MYMAHSDENGPPTRRSWSGTCIATRLNSEKAWQVLRKVIGFKDLSQMKYNTEEKFLQPILEKVFNGMAEVMQNFFNLAMKIEREKFFARWRPPSV